MATKSGRTIEHVRKHSIGKFLLRWEVMLFLIFLVVNVINYNLSPDST